MNLLLGRWLSLYFQINRRCSAVLQFCICVRRVYVQVCICVGVLTQGKHLCSSYAYTNVSCNPTVYIPYILESNPHPFYSFRGLKNQMRIRIACGLDSRPRAGFWKNYTAAVRAVRTIQ